MVNAFDKVATLFGIRHRDETDSYFIKHQHAWHERRKRLLNRRCGRLACRDDPNQSGLTARGERNDHQSRKRQPRSIMVLESKTLASIDDSKTPMARVKDDRNRLPSTIIPVAASSSAAAATEAATITTTTTSTTHKPLYRTTSDTAVHHTTAKPQYPQELKHLDEDNRSLGSSFYDLTDFDAKQSIVNLVNDVLSRHQPKRAFGMGIVGNLLSRKFRDDLTYSQLTAIYSFNDHRPYFTYWVTTVQILIMIITLFTYGFGPFGFSNTLVQESIYVSSKTYHKEAYPEKDNIWYGPRQSDLIHLGAKFTPCMRKDSHIFREIYKDREDERATGCCIRKDHNSCLQTKKEACSYAAKWHSWNESSEDAPKISNNNRRRRTSGPVCGQDPQYCRRPDSIDPHEWPDDITQWPICQERLEATKPFHHTSCEVVGRPCCHGIYGQCHITTGEHCQFLRGTFHSEATLCSQVSCMEDVCGMVPFYARDHPDQFYRLFTALFLHAGLIHLSFTVILQYYIMRDIERLLGSTRMAILYILPGIAGYLASATFVPYHTQVGPSGSQFALLACLMAETINSWRLLEDPMSSLWRLIFIAIGLFILGLLPWIDNYAHIFGFIVGLLLSLALTPYLTPFNDAYSRRKKVIQIWVCIILVILTFVLLPLPLYIFPLYECSWCQYLDCWPLTPNWCENHNINVTRLDVF